MGEPFTELWEAVSSRVQELRRQECYVKKLPKSEHEHELMLHNAFLLPDHAANKYFKAWEEDLVDEIGQAGISESRVPIFFSMVYYGPDEKPTTDDWNHMVDFVETWIAKTKCNVKPFQRCDLVYCYFLGIGRELSAPTTKNVWGDTGGFAAWAFDMFVSNQSMQLRHRLEKVNLYDTSLSEPEMGTTGIAILNILKGDGLCSCADSYTKRHPKAKKSEVEARHHREHRLTAWWDRSAWSEKRKSDGQFWALYYFVSRALFGEVPITIATGDALSSIKLASLDKGLLFELLVPQPHVFTTLVCSTMSSSSRTESGKCRRVIEDFQHCQECDTDAPQFETDTRLRSPDDLSWREVKTRKCVHCERYFELITTEKLCPQCNEIRGDVSTLKKKPGNPFCIWLFSPYRDGQQQGSHSPGELATEADYYSETIDFYYGPNADAEFSFSGESLSGGDFKSLLSGKENDEESGEQFDDE